MTKPKAKTVPSGARAGKRLGRKASGLRELPPEAARLAISCASLGVVRGAMKLQVEARKGPGASADAAPTLERLIRQDIALVQVRDPWDGELRPMLGARSLGERMKAAGIDAGLAWVAEKFVADVEQSRIGGMTSNYGDGVGGGVNMDARQAALVMRLRRLVKAQKDLTPKERGAVWGVLVFGLGFIDVGWALAGERLKGRRQSLSDAGVLFLEAALEKMAVHYRAIGD